MSNALIMFWGRKSTMSILSLIFFVLGIYSLVLTSLLELRSEIATAIFRFIMKIKIVQLTPNIDAEVVSKCYARSNAQL